MLIKNNKSFTCHYINSSHLELILELKKAFTTTKNDSITIISEIGKTSSNNYSNCLILVDKELSKLSLKNLTDLEQLKNCVFLFTQQLNQEDSLIIKKILNWKEIKINLRQSKHEYYLPKIIFLNMPTLDRNITYLKKPADLFKIDTISNIVFSNFHLYSSSKNIFLSTISPLDFFKSICSIKKIMQYFWLRSYRDIA